MRGRKPKPTHIKVITGNPGKRKLNFDEPRPEIAVPTYPPELSPAAQREWDRLVGELCKLNLLTNLDRLLQASLPNEARTSPRLPALENADFAQKRTSHEDVPVYDLQKGN